MDGKGGCVQGFPSAPLPQLTANSQATVFENLIGGVGV